MKQVFFIAILFIGTITIKAQTLDEEVGFRLVKAEYLISTERFEDAIKELNEVLKQNANFKNAMLLRAETKYKLAAFKGAKQDAIEYISQNGITSKAAAILGKAEYAMGNADAALNSLTAAIALGEKDVKLFETRAEIFESKNQKISACEDWQSAAKLGSTKGAINAKKLCGIKADIPVEPTKQDPPKNTDDSTVDDSTTNNQGGGNSGSTTVDSTQIQPNEVLSEGTQTGNTTTPTNTTTTPTTTEAGNSTENTNTTPDLLLPEEDNTPNKFVVDEELTLEIFGQGLGKRAIMEKPSILILAEKDGVVTVEICVNSEGRVDFAEFVPGKSSLNQNSLVSLAIRKSKEFWFENSEYPKQCGFIKFIIKGS